MVFLGKTLKKVVCINGNCQAEALLRFIKTNTDFNAQFKISFLKPVYLINHEDVEEYKNSVAACDVFITQPIGGQHYKDLGIDTESAKKILKPDVKIIKIPVAYFSGYFPEQFYLQDENGFTVGECEGLPSPYHNKIILYGYINGLSEVEVLQILNNDVNIKNIKDNMQNSINELKRREQELDITISDYIENNYKKHRLFWSINHPANILIKYISEELLNQLGIKAHWYQFGNLVRNHRKECLGGYKTPIVKSVAKELNLEFNRTIKYCLNDIVTFYKYYDAHPNLVNINKPVVEKIIEAI